MKAYLRFIDNVKAAKPGLTRVASQFG